MTIGELQISPRLTVANLRRLKKDANIDLCEQDGQAYVAFATDPDYTIIVAYHLYRDQFEAKNMTEDDLANLCGPDEIITIRKEVDARMRGFSTFWKMISTETEGLLTGAMSLEDVGKATERLQAASGRTS